jgi:formylglycine-generating enzyme required for sulfatase activity
VTETYEAANPTTPPTITAPEANKNWRPKLFQTGNSDMMLVPSGCFRMGSDGGQPNEKPQHQVCVATFLIDRLEVRNEIFALANGSAAAPSQNTQPRRPRENITWFEAREYCAKRGARLPTEAEWEYAARGPESALYPWGRDFDSKLAVSAATGAKEPSDVGQNPANASWVGALDMTGNVAEWTSTIAKAYPFDPADGRENPSDTAAQRIVRGGSFNSQPTELRSSVRQPVEPGQRSPSIGFRCAQDYPPK